MYYSTIILSNMYLQVFPEKDEAAWLERAALAAIDEGVISSVIGMRAILIPGSFSSRPWSTTLGLMTNDSRVKGRPGPSGNWPIQPVAFPKGTAWAPQSKRLFEPEASRAGFGGTR